MNYMPNIKDIQNEDRGIFLMKLEEEDTRHQIALKELQEKLEENPKKITEFKVSYKRHTNFGCNAIDGEE